MQWTLWNYTEEINIQMANKWRLKSKTLAVQNFSYTILEDREVVISEKSLLILTIKLERIALSPIISVIVPTVVLSFFNNVAFFLPRGGILKICVYAQVPSLNIRRNKS